MAARSKKTNKEIIEATAGLAQVVINENDIIPEEEIKNLQPEEIEEVVIEPKTKSKKAASIAIAPKAKIGDIVYVSKEADADLNGFKLFPQYKKYTYTVEDYDAVSDVYTLRRLNLSLRLKGELILRPEEKAHDKLNRIQF